MCAGVKGSSKNATKKQKVADKAREKKEREYAEKAVRVCVKEKERGKEKVRRQ
jgi:hypothetical protein